MITTILFDLDGTLMFGDLKQSAAIRQDLLDHYELELSDEERQEYEKLGFKSRNEFLAKHVTKKNGKEVTAADILEYVKSISANYDDLFQLDENAIEVLEYFKNEGFVVGLVTDRGPNSTPRLLKHLNIEQYFKTVVHMLSCEKRKPFPDPILKALTDLNVDASTAVYIGNEEKDYKAAKAAGVFPIIVENQFSPDGIDTIKSMRDCIEIVEKMNTP